MRPTVTVDYSRFRAMAQDLARASAQPYERVLTLNAASLVKRCALWAKIASAAKIKADVALARGASFREPYGGSSVIVVNTRRSAGRVWFAYFSYSDSLDRGSGRNGIRHVGAVMIFDAGPSRGWHVRDTVWQDYLTLAGYRAESLKRTLQARLRARGLMRLSWLQVGDALGVPLSTVSPSGSLQEVVARNAVPSSGRTYRNGIVRIEHSAASLVIHLRNQSPLAIKNQGQGAMDRAAAIQLAQYQRDLEKGVFADLQLRAARWRGIFVRPA